MSCPDCFRGSVHAHTEATGTIETVHGIRTYIAGGSDPSRSKSAILYLPDGFSLKLVNNKILADKYASMTGCRVLIPDVVYRGGMVPEMLDKMEYIMDPLPKWTVGGVFGKFFTTLSILPTLIPFLLFGHPDKVYDKILAYARAMKAELPEGGKLGVAGFCWGGWPSSKLCAETATPGGSERLIDAQFNGHPSYIVKTPEMVVEAIKKFKVPYCSAVAADDRQFNEKVAADMEAKVKQEAGESGEGGCIYEFRIYKGCKHGFCVRAKSNTENMDGYNAAVKQAAEWFNKYLN
ncbi:uncharacterized protein Z518_06004 [Rhinocladiella mackenziei CBS 650.93]|uniref:Dienelactone hydrolase domain-containing protein n=1 Tax=Rhinocladiella mackenziei CBS 650.93 TaxID=1442369 RepID=A0A0D2FSM9_9EURO|nr:uncharacterized protein Z518_06004 [Rhinocladiella mackenziei CBS 650.93]KIX05132.1 hypothetical protein Z518_06004 [Rhinocladiella mackenziei CBS 650.93]